MTIERQVSELMKNIYSKIVNKGGLFERTGKLHEHMPKPPNKHFLTFDEVLRIKSGKIDHMYIVLPPYKTCTYRLDNNDKGYFPHKFRNGVFTYMNKYAVTGPESDIYWKVSPELLKFLESEYRVISKK